MPWKKQFDVEAARERARDVFWSKGYEATSMEDLLTGMDINRGSFYATFGSKHDLYVDVLRRYDQTHRCAALEHLKVSMPPRDAIMALFQVVQREAAGAKGARGCFLANATMELAASDTVVERLVRDAFAQTEEFFQTMIRKGQQSGEIREEVDPEVVARTLLGLLLGMRVLARSSSPAPVLKSIVTQVSELL